MSFSLLVREAGAGVRGAGEPEWTLDRRSFISIINKTES